MNYKATSKPKKVQVGLTITTCAVLAILFYGFGLSMHKLGFALTGTILNTVAYVISPICFMFTIIHAILSYIGYVKMKNK